MMLAYVFWHFPQPNVDPAGYEAALLSFHHSLDRTAIDGFHSSAVFRIEGVPWMAGPTVYEDWYLVKDFSSLGSLNAAAVTDGRQAPHDTVAHLAARGAAGVYALRRGPEVISGARKAGWFQKPVGISYDQFVDVVGGRGQLWQRQLVLGPTPEFCLLGGEAPSDALVVTRTSLR